jgi:DNA-binding PadR family transcriptional regulator
MFGSGELRLLLLKLIADESRHGYELIKAVEELTGGEYAPSPGVVYPTLSLLVDEGKIAEAAGDGPRKAFTVTDEGLAELGERSEEADRLIERLASLAEKEHTESPPIRRAVANLFIAVRERVRAGGFEAETAHQIAEILDEAARRIERL